MRQVARPPRWAMRPVTHPAPLVGHEAGHPVTPEGVKDIEWAPTGGLKGSMGGPRESVSENPAFAAARCFFFDESRFLVKRGADAHGV